MNEVLKDRKQAQNVETPSVDYGRLHNSLKLMLEQQYREGDRIASERKLAAEFKVAPATISRVLQNLARSGIVRRVRGSGTYVCDRALHSLPAPPASSGVSSPPLEKHPFGIHSLAVQSTHHAPLKSSLSGCTIGIIAEVGDTPSRLGEPEHIVHRIASAIEREIQSYGGHTRIIDTQRHVNGSERAVIAEMMTNGVDSLVLIDYGPQMARWLPLLLNAHGRVPGGVPLVLALINDTCDWPVDCVRIDDAWGVFEATTHLLHKGHRQLAFLSLAQGYFSWADARAVAFRRAVDAWNVANDASASGTVLYGSSKYCTRELDCEWVPTCQELAEKFVQTKGVTGVVAVNDFIALPFISLIKAKGIRVPEDISLISYDNIVQAASADLCTLDLPAEQVGIQVAQLCRQRLTAPVSDSRIEIALKPILLMRGSVRSFSHASS